MRKQPQVGSPVLRQAKERQRLHDRLAPGVNVINTRTHIFGFYAFLATVCKV